jgi:hypothetical protein
MATIRKQLSMTVNHGVPGSSPGGGAEMAEDLQAIVGLFLFGLNIV